MIRPYIGAACVLLLAAGTALAQPAVESFADQAAGWWPSYLKDSKLITLANGRQLNLYCQGPKKEKPVVILEPGLGKGAFSRSEAGFTEVTSS